MHAFHMQQSTSTLWYLKYAATMSDCEQTVLCVILWGMVPSSGDSCISAVCLHMGATQSRLLSPSGTQIIPVGKYDCVYKAQGGDFQ